MCKSSKTNKLYNLNNKKMFKLLFILFILALFIFLVIMAFKLGKQTSHLNSNHKYKQGGEVDELELDSKIKNVISKIESLENSIPISIEDKEKKVEKLEAELEKLKRIKLKFQ